MFGDEPGLYHEGERVDYRWGESTGDAVNRHVAKKAVASKLAAQKADDASKAAELQRLRSDSAKLQQAIDAKESLAKLSQERDALQCQLDAKTSPTRRHGIRFAQGGFNPFRTNRPAA